MFINLSVIGQRYRRIQINVPTKVSLGALVPNSRDRHENNGDRILCTTKHPKMRFVWEKQTEVHF